MDKSAIKIIRELRRFKKENGISRIIFFGSRRNRKYNKYSDVDLVVISPKFRRLRSFKRAPTLRLKLNLSYPVDMLCYTPEEFERKKSRPTIVREAVKTGVEI